MKRKNIITETGPFWVGRAIPKKPLLHSVPNSTFPTVFYSSIKSKSSKRVERKGEKKPTKKKKKQKPTTKLHREGSTPPIWLEKHSSKCRKLMLRPLVQMSLGDKSPIGRMVWQSWVCWDSGSLLVGSSKAFLWNHIAGWLALRHNYRKRQRIISFGEEKESSSFWMPDSEFTSIWSSSIHPWNIILVHWNCDFSDQLNSDQLKKFRRNSFTMLNHGPKGKPYSEFFTSS